MRVRTKLHAGGGMTTNHNESGIRAPGLKIKAAVKAGGFGTSPGIITPNHSETLVRP